MKLLILSDLHLEFYRDPSAVIQAFPREGFDIVVLAGDIVSGAKFRITLETVCEYFADKRIVFVCGNHEYYKSNRPLTSSALRSIEKRYSNFVWLENESVIVGGVTILGTTLWFRKCRLAEAQSDSLADFHAIEGFREWNYSANIEAIGFLNANVRSDTIVVTHHLPTERSVHERYKGDPFNCYFLCDMEDLIETKRPPLWIHGHTHESVDTIVADTRVVCNPMGYPHEGGGMFRTDKIVTV